jgi:salicylate hydroxylase
VVVGGGIGGLTAALCLTRRGLSVTVVEQAPRFEEIGAGIQLSPNCTRVLHCLGLEEALRQDAFLPEATQFRHWRTGKVISQSPLGEAALARFGTPYYHMHRGDLLKVLVTAAEADPLIRLITGLRIDTVTQDDSGVRAEAGGEILEGEYLVGADGIHSVVRAALWGAEKPRFTGNVAWRALVPADRLPPGLIRPMSTAWWGPGRHFVHYFVRRGELVNCVCVVEKAGWEVESWTEPGDHAELRADFAGWHETIGQLIDNMDRDSLFKWALHDRAPMGRWSQGRITLLGDACHPTLPFMAQGAAMAIEDAAVLADCLAAEGGERALRRYETLRLKRTARIQNGSRRNATLFHLSGVKAWLRDRAARKAGERTMDGLYGYNVFEAMNQEVDT